MSRGPRLTGLHGPVNADPDLLQTVLRLFEVRGGSRLSLADFDHGAPTRQAVRDVLWQVTYPAMSAEEYRRLRYSPSLHWVE